MRYDPVMIQPFRDELTRVGFKELRTVEDVERTLFKEEGTNLLVINSVCGCAAGKARPGIEAPLKQSPVRPDSLTTVFAGADLESTARVREHMENISPSSPSIALFRGSTLLHFVPRFQIEGRDALQISEHLVEVFQEHCSSGVESESDS